MIKKFLAIFRRQVNRLHMNDGKSNFDEHEPTASDIEQVVDATRADLGLPPAERSPEQGVADMEARIRELTETKRQILDQWPTIDPDKNLEVYAEVKRIDQDLQEAKQRLGEYQIQLEGRN